ncbi:hypothetical protein JCM5350_007368 [Sporobolomyces pararoseus]
MSTSRPFPRPPEFPLAPQDLQRWIRFSTKGGVGKARAKVDRASEDGVKDLMMLEGDEIVVLMDLGGDLYLGHCEGVVGLFRGRDVDFLQARLKKPVMTPRSSSSKVSNNSTSLTKSPNSTTADALAHDSFQPPILTSVQTENRDEMGSSRGEPSETRWNKQVEQSRDDALDERRGTIEGLGLGVGVEESLGRMQISVTEEKEQKTASTMRSPDLAGAFPAVGSHSPALCPDETSSPAYSSDSHTVPSLFTSPTSEDTSHSVPRTPYTPASDSLSITWNSKDLPLTPSSNRITEESLREKVSDLIDDPPLDPRPKSSPSLVSSGLPIPLPHSSFSHSPQPSIESVPPSLSSPSHSRQPKSSTSTGASKASQESTVSTPTSAPNSLPGTPGDDPTLAFIFDSYRYSVTPSLVTGGGGGPSTIRFPTTTASPILATREESDPEEVQVDEQVMSDQGVRSLGRFGAASELRERMRRGEAASALPPHISPTRTRHDSNSSSISTSDGVQFLRRSQIFPRSTTSDSLASFDTSENGSEFSTRAPPQKVAHSTLEIGQYPDDSIDVGSPARGHPESRLSESPESLRSTMQRRTESSINGGRKRMQNAPPALSIPSSLWRSQNESSPVSQVVWTEIDQSAGATDVFVDSPVSSQSHGHFDEFRVAQSPNRKHLDSDQYPLRPPASGDSHAPTPSSISFHSSVSTEDIHGGSLDHSGADISDSSRAQSTNLPNKLRKKSSFRLRKSQSASRRQMNDTPDSVVNYTTPPLPAIPNRSASDPFYATSPPASPARQLSRKNSIGSKFSRKSSEKEREKEKKVDYGAGISSKDFEEETVQIGANAFEIVKPYAALLAQDGDKEKEEVRQVDNHLVVPDQTQNYLTSPLRTQFSTPSPQLQQSFSSHFSPPTPLSVEGDGKSVEDHRAKELKWVQTLGSGITAAQVRKSKKMRSLVQSGVPSSVRGKVWAFLAEADKEKKVGLYAHLCSLGAGEYSSVIQHELESLLVDNPQFAQGAAGREDLEAVLNAFSHFDRQLGYYNGLANIVALLLTQMPAEESFWTLISLVRNYGFRQFFAVGREELRLETIAFTFLLEMVEPKIARRFRELEINTFDYLFSWLSTFFLSVLPLPTVQRVLEIFLLDPKIRYRAPLAILSLAHYTDSDVFPSRDSVLNYLLAPPPTAFPPTILIPTINNYKLSDDKVHKAIKKAAQEMLSPRN